MDGRFAGYGIRLKNTTFIAPVESCAAADSSSHRAYEPRLQFQFSNYNKINVRNGPQDGKHEREYRCHLVKGLSADFGVFHYDGLRQGAIGNLREKNLLREMPQLQSDVNVKDNCHMYAYSHTHTDPISPEAADRTFSKIPVRHEGCNGDSCRFKANIGGLRCGRFSDAGAPIMCGGGNVISHIVKPGGWKDICVGEFDTFHVAPHHKTITELANFQLEGNADLLMPLPNWVTDEPFKGIGVAVAEQIKSVIG